MLRYIERLLKNFISLFKKVLSERAIEIFLKINTVHYLNMFMLSRIVRWFALQNKLPLLANAFTRTYFRGVALALDCYDDQLNLSVVLVDYSAIMSTNCVESLLISFSFNMITAQNIFFYAMQHVKIKF